MPSLEYKTSGDIAHCEVAVSVTDESGIRKDTVIRSTDEMATGNLLANLQAASQAMRRDNFLFR